MPIDIVPSLEFVVTLNREYDYFDIIPALEQEFRMRFVLNRSHKNSDSGDVVVVYGVMDTYRRYHNTSLHLGIDPDKYSYQETFELVNGEIAQKLPIEIAWVEELTIKKVVQFLADMDVVASSGWRYNCKTF